MGLELIMPAFVAQEKSSTVTPVVTGTPTFVGETVSGAFINFGLTSHKDALYASIFVRARDLYTLNATTGAGTKVGSATNFGLAGSFFPESLASHNGVLYMAVRATNNALYTLNTTTGVATRVGSATNFGLSGASSYSPQGMTSHNGVLYVCIESNLYTLNTTTGVATRVGSATNFGTGRRAFTVGALASHDGKLYVTEEEGDSLYTVDSDDGNATIVGSLSNTANQDGLASHNGVLYMLAARQSPSVRSALWTIA